MSTARNFLIAGLGSIGRRHLRNLKALGAGSVYAYRSRGLPVDDEPLLDGTFTSLDEALDLGPDAVLVTNPTSLHLSVALEAARRGAHLFIEKPLSHTMEGVDELIETVGKQSLVGLVGCNLRWHPGLLTVRRLLEDDRVGRPLAASVEVGEYLPSWHPWEDYRIGYSARADMGGGVVLTLIHELDYAWWLFGPVSEVFAYAGQISRLEVDVEDMAKILLRYDSGLVVDCSMDYLQSPPVRRLKIIGEAGRIEWDAFGEGVRLLGPNGGEGETIPHPAGFGRNDMYLAEMSHFLACLEGHEKPLIPLEVGRDVLRIALAAKASAASGRPVAPGEIR